MKGSDVNMYDEILGNFKYDGKGKYETTYVWSGNTIFLTYFKGLEGNNEIALSILHELCANQEYWNNTMLEFLRKDESGRFATHYAEYYSIDNLRLLEILVSAGSYYKCYKEEDFSFALADADGENGITVIWLRATLKDGIIELDSDLYWRGTICPDSLFGNNK